MTASKKAPSTRRPPLPRGGSQQVIPLRRHAEEALSAYFSSLNGHRPARLYELVLREVELPLFKSVMDYAEGNQSRAATILGINRGTLRKKLREYGLSD
jgi:Fis family transcriptional regulator